MAGVDTTNKRRSATSIFHVYIIPPFPDATIDEQDREQATLIYAGIPVELVVPVARKPTGLLLGVYGYHDDV